MQCNINNGLGDFPLNKLDHNYTIGKIDLMDKGTSWLLKNTACVFCCVYCVGQTQGQRASFPTAGHFSRIQSSFRRWKELTVHDPESTVHNYTAFDNVSLCTECLLPPSSVLGVCCAPDMLSLKTATDSRHEIVIKLCNTIVLSCNRNDKFLQFRLLFLFLFFLPELSSAPKPYRCLPWNCM